MLKMIKKLKRFYDLQTLPEKRITELEVEVTSLVAYNRDVSCSLAIEKEEVARLNSRGYEREANLNRVKSINGWLSVLLAISTTMTILLAITLFAKL